MGIWVCTSTLGRFSTFETEQDTDLDPSPVDSFDLTLYTSLLKSRVAPNTKTHQVRKIHKDDSADF